LRILILTPDTEIDRRIILQANSLVKDGYEVTIVGVPHAGDNLLSGHMHENIQIKRIQLSDLEYHSWIVKFYRGIHAQIRKLANHYRKPPQSADANQNAQVQYSLFNKLKRKAINLTLRSAIRIFSLVINLGYNVILYFFRLFNVNIFPIFDKAFFNAGKTEQVDLIVANDLPSLQAGYLLAQAHKVPLIYDAHENYTEQITLSKGYAAMLEKVEVDVVPHVRFWIVPNELMGEQIIRKYKIKYDVEFQRPLVIQNAVKFWPEYRNQAGNDWIRAKLQLPREYKILLFQGGFIKNRNLEPLIEAMKYTRNKHVKLVMLGFGTYVEVLKAKVKRGSLEQQVYFLDAVPQDALLQVTCSADAGIIPYPAVDRNTRYCSPNKLYEFIQARLPILANDLPYLRKMIVGQDIGAVYELSSPKAVARAIDHFFSDETRLQRYRENLELLSSEVCWEVEENKLIEEYRLISRGGVICAASME
jgi:glycosyltransferase involved in cell wall biosynthesis